MTDLIAFVVCLTIIAVAELLLRFRNRRNDVMEQAANRQLKTMAQVASRRSSVQRASVPHATQASDDETPVLTLVPRRRRVSDQPGVVANTVYSHRTPSKRGI